MSNKSAEYPDNGYLSKDILNSFWSVTGNDSDSLVYTYGVSQDLRTDMCGTFAALLYD